MLLDRHLEARAHQELVCGWITAAVKNYSMCPPEEPATALDYMPSHRDHAPAAPELSEEELERASDWNQRVMEMAAELKARSGNG